MNAILSRRAVVFHFLAILSAGFLEDQQKVKRQINSAFSHRGVGYSLWAGGGDSSVADGEII
jgi:hypothetical protein